MATRPPGWSPLLPALALLLAAPPALAARKAKAPSVPPVPSIDDVVAAEGFTPTPSQSDIYRPGAVLVPNARGGHDVVVEGCVDAEPAVSVMSQSSIATTLAGGVSARLGVARAGGSAAVEKRLSFVDPEQRTIALGDLSPSPDCAEKVQTAARFADLSEAIVLHDVLVAIIKNTVCTRADASGAVVALGKAEAAGFAECVQESDGQVPLGYKSVPLSRLLGIDASAAVAPDVQVQLGGEAVDFAALAAESEAAQRDAAAAERRRDAAMDQVRKAAARDFVAIQGLVADPTPASLAVFEAWLDRYGDAKVTVDGSVYSVPLPQTPLVQQARDATAMPSTSRIGRLAKGYYDKKGQWAGTFVIAKVEGVRVVETRDPARFVAHVAYGYASAPGQEQSPGTDARTFTFAFQEGRWQCVAMGGHESGKL